MTTNWMEHVKEFEVRVVCGNTLYSSTFVYLRADACVIARKFTRNPECHAIVLEDGCPVLMYRAGKRVATASKGCWETLGPKLVKRKISKESIDAKL